MIARKLKNSKTWKAIMYKECPFTFPLKKILDIKGTLYKHYKRGTCPNCGKKNKIITSSLGIIYMPCKCNK